MHLRIELLGRRDGFLGPGDVVVCRQIAGAVDSVPGVIASGPGKSGAKRGQQVIQSPGHDGVVVESDIQGNNADGKSYTYKNNKQKTQRNLLQTHQA